VEGTEVEQIKQLLAWFFLLLVRFFNYRGRLDTVIAVCNAGLRYAVPDSRVMCELLLKHAFARYRNGYHTIFVRDAVRGLEMADHRGYPDLAATAHGMFGIYHQQREAREDAIAAYRSAVSVFQSLADPDGEAKVLIPLGTLYREMSDFRRSLEVFDRARQISRKRRLCVNALLEQGRLEFILGNMDAAEDWVRRALNGAGWIPWLRFPNEIGDCHRQLARIAVRQGVITEARDHYRRAHFMYRLWGYRDKAEAILGEVQRLQAA
jgi:tetratricopeptide (TPR) repeat protein